MLGFANNSEHTVGNLFFLDDEVLGYKILNAYTNDNNKKGFIKQYSDPTYKSSLLSHELSEKMSEHEINNSDMEGINKPKKGFKKWLKVYLNSQEKEVKVK